MSSALGDLYRRFFEACKNANPYVAVEQVQIQVNKEWKEAKNEFNKNDPKFKNFILEKINDYKIQKTKSELGLMHYFASSSVSIIRNTFFLFLFCLLPLPFDNS